MHPVVQDLSAVFQAFMAMGSLTAMFLTYRLYRRQDRTKLFERDGRVHDRVEEHEREITGLQGDGREVAAALNTHLIECARQHATHAAVLAEVRGMVEKMERSVSQLQSQMRFVATGEDNSFFRREKS